MASLPATGEVAVRAIPVAKGQVLQATVVELLDGVAWLGYRGSVFAARTQMALEKGRSYEFTVVRTEPFVELGPANAGAAATRPDVLAEGGAWWTKLWSKLSALDTRNPGASKGAIGVDPFATALARVFDGEITADLLRTVQHGLGHDQEARVLRLALLPESERGAAAATLQTTAKARALGALTDEDGHPLNVAERDAARALVFGLSAIERDNVARSELGVPQWLPLPACPAMGLQDARMFLATADGGADSAEGEGSKAPFTIVLLLDFTTLSSMRVDLLIHDLEVDVTFTVVRPETAAMLVECAAAVRADLTAGGLVVRDVRVQRAPRAQLSCTDLVLPPRDGSALVDCHA